MSERRDRERHAASFDGVADVYEASRPTYPQEAADWLVPADAHTVIDVGAGTGKFTRSLVRDGRSVIAVDPAPQMLEYLQQALPQVDARVGSGESIPVEEGAADAVTFAQAWHWVDIPSASAEVGRVLRPGGTLGLIWNFRDERDPWVARLSVAMHADGDQYTDALGEPRIAEPFDSPTAATFPWTAVYSRQTFLDLVRSRSYFALMDSAQQQTVLADVSSLIDEACGTDPDVQVSLPYVTVCFRYRRP